MKRNTIDDFWAKVNKSEEGCWEWGGGTTDRGYGELYINRRQKKAHRLAYEITYGAIPTGMYVRHKCDNRKCVRPDHLFLGTGTDWTGQKFGSLTFIRPTEERSKSNGIIWELKCDCGNTRFSPSIYITKTNAPTLSCGCLTYEKTANTVEDFDAKIRRSNPAECWEWQGCIDDKGYGVSYWQGKPTFAHRFAWSLANGPIPDGMFICHKCDNPLCCNPNHLFLGTHQDNMADMVSKGRSAKGEKQGSSVLTEEQVLTIREEYARGSATYLGLGKKYGVADVTIRQIILRRTWKHI